MVHFQILTLFPELFEPFQTNGLLRRAIGESKAEISVTQLREFAINSHGQVDDSPYGGGSGMVLRPETAQAAIHFAKNKDPKTRVVVFSPRGKKLSQKSFRAWAEDAKTHNQGFTLLCNRYEGIDERVLQELVDEEVSIGDYILMGGEVPAMAFIEGICRLLPGVLGNPESILSESFSEELLEHPQFTKPREFLGKAVPDVLLSGNHAEIQKWQFLERKRVTAQRRPELIVDPILPKTELSLALIHYPVTDKHGDIVASSITNIDLHDMARTSKTFGVNTLYAVHPLKSMRQLSQKICDHWNTGYGATYNPNRKEALGLLRIVPALEDALAEIEQRTGRLPKVVTTSARPSPKSTTFAEFRQTLLLSDEPYLLLFGTGWGMAPELLERAEIHLEPIVGATDYNHLSVRSACAIMMDKILGAQPKSIG